MTFTKLLHLHLHLGILLGIVLGNGLSAGSAIAAAGTPDASTASSQNTPVPTTNTGITGVIGPASSAYLVECYDENETHISSIELLHANEIDPLRCVRKTYGDLLFDAKGDSTLSQIDVLVLPWIEYVGGDVRVVKPGTSPNTFDTIKLSRLAHISGKLALDFNPAFEGLRLPSLTTVDAVEIDLRRMDLDLTGLDSLVSIAGQLSLNNPNPGDPPVFRGLHGLTEVGSLSISGRGAFDDTAGIGLSSLTLVRGNVTINVVAPETVLPNYHAIYATPAIETICGNLTITGDETNLNLATDFASLNHVVGSVTLNGTNVSNQIPGLATGGQPAACQ